MSHGRVQLLNIALILGMLLLALGAVSLLLGGRVYDHTPDGLAWHGRYGRFAVGIGVIAVAATAGLLRFG